MFVLLDRISSRLADAGQWIAMGFLCLLFVLINTEIVSRYLFGRSTLIADEYGGYLFVGIVFLGMANAMRKGQFLSVDLLVDHLAPRARNALLATGLTLGSALVLVLLVNAADLVAVSWRFGSVSIQPSATPLVAPQSLVIVGLAMLLLTYVAAAVQKWVAFALTFRRAG